jgi:hypothetical protein
VPDRIQRHLLPDDSVLLDVDRRLERAVSSWVALDGCRGNGGDGGAQWASRLYVHHAPMAGADPPPRPPTLRVGAVGVWLPHESGGRAQLGAAECHFAGSVDLQWRQAALVTDGSDAAAPHLHTALTLATALLLGRLGRALVQAAAVVQPGGRAWLLTDPERVGCLAAAFARLTQAGWPGLAIHRVVLRQDGESGAVAVVGLPEREGVAGTDAGWTRHVGSAELAGVIVLRSTPPEPTVLVRMAEADLLTALTPESPWLRLDRSGAAGVLRALQTGLRLPTFELRQGLDTYADRGRLAEVLEALPRGGTGTA